MKIDPTSTLTQGPEWIDALCSFTAWRDASRHYETSDGRSFVLPLVEKRVGKVGRVLASMPPGWGMGGFVSSYPMRSGDVAAVVSDLRSLRCLRFRILPNPLRGDAWVVGVGDNATTLPRYSHIVDLDGGFETVWSEGYSRSGLKTLKKALEGDLDIERDTTGRLIPVYRDLFERSIERWASRSREPLWMARIRGNREDPAGKLEYLAETLGEQMVTWVAWHHGEPAAAAIDLKGNSTFAWRGAMHEELGPATHASYVLQHLSIKESCDAGKRYYYLGESGESSGIALFKERLGGVGYNYPEVRHERLPFTKVNQAARTVVKRLIRYRSS